MRALRGLAVVTLCSTLLPAWGLVATPTRLEFDPQAIGTTSPPRSVVVGGFAPGETLGAISLPPGFEATHDCVPGTATPCTIQVRFVPTNQESVEASLAIAALPAGTGGDRAVTLAGAGERSLVSHYYRTILRRAPDAGGKAFWEAESTRMQRAGGNPEETLFALAAAFFSSAEYQALGRSDAGFLEDLYRAFFLRAPDPGGAGFWAAQLAQGMPREVALTTFLLSTEFGAVARRLFGASAVRKEIDTVMDFYRGMLARLPDNAGLAYWVGQFRGAQCGTAAAVAAKAEEISGAFLNSAEYAGRKRSNPQYVGDLYNAFLRRGGDLQGVQYWIGQLDGGAQSRESLRKAFLASPEFTGRIAQVLAEGCYQGASSESLLEGSHRYAGSFPAAGPVTYLNQDGVSVTHPRAYPGFVMIQSTFSTEANVATLVAPYGGTIVAAIPMPALYMVKVPDSAAFISAVKGLSWVQGAWPAQPLERGTQLIALDSRGPATSTACDHNHALYVVDIMSRRSATPGSYVDVDGRDGLEISWELGYRMYEAQRKGERLIVNISMQSASSGPKCQTPEACMAARQGQLEFLRAVVKMMQINADVQPERANNTLVTVIAGNAGAQLDLELGLLKLLYPKGFERIAVVGGSAPNNVIDVRYNHLQVTSSRNILYARSDDVQVGGTTCDGTSFAAPEVASILDYVWSRRPDLGSAAILKALHEQMAVSTVVIPQDANGRTPQSFLDQVVARLPLPACSYVYSEWGACQPNNTQTRTVISSSPAQCQGTPVLQQPCTYVPPDQPCTYTYSAWSSCVNGQETRTVVSATPAGCTGTPVLSRPCSDNLCCACTFDVYCTAFGPGGCWYCSQGSYVGQSCTASGALVSPGACSCSASLYQVCRP